jgi:glyoxylase-like metal-dependent hydrolase (beta-lactamase superfamily II)
MTATFSRRAFLKTATLSTIASTVPPLLSARMTIAQTTPSAPRNTGFYRFKLGNFQMAVLSDGVLSAPAAAFAGDVTPEQLNAVLQAGFQSDTLTPDCNILFVDTGRNRVIIDTGSGSLSGPTAGKLLENLRAAQIDLSAIDTVIITHAHQDHVGGLTDQAGTLVFPNAQYYVSRPEYTFWTGNPSLPKLRGGAEMAQGFIALAQKQLGALGQRVTQFEVDREIIPGFSATSTPGHTPGHVAIRITSGETSLIHTADVVHMK